MNVNEDKSYKKLWDSILRKLSFIRKQKNVENNITKHSIKELGK